MTKKTLLIFLIIILGSLITFKLTTISKFSNMKNVVTKVFAEDDDDEDRGEDREDRDEEEDDDDEYENYYKNTPVEEYIIVEEPAPIVSYITVFDAGYDKDTDADGLVDALDPNPTVKESEFFTDDDKDGISNAYDTFPNEDDFLYLEFTDTNSNGLIDDLENLN